MQMGQDFWNIQYCFYRQTHSRIQQKFNVLVKIFLMVGIPWLAEVSSINPNGGEGRGQIEPCDAKICEKGLYFHHNKTTVLRKKYHC